MHKIPLELIDLKGDGFHILTNIIVFGKTFRIVIDTGASKTVLDKSTVIEAGIHEEEILATDVLSTGLGTNSMASYLLDLSELQLGTWKKKHVKVAVLDLTSINYAYNQMQIEPVIGVLGGDILVNYGAVIDYEQMTLSLLNKKLKLKKSTLNT